MASRIAHVISTRGPGGAERFLAALVREGEARGWEQVVLNPFATDASEAVAALCAPTPVAARRCDSPRELPATRRWLRTRLADFTPDVVHIVLFHALFAMATLPKVPGTTRIATNVYGDGARAAPHGRLFPLADRWAGRRVDHVAAISQSVRRFLVSDYGYPASRVTCIPLGWEGTPQAKILSPRPPTIIGVGGLRAEKGYDILLAAMPLVREEVPDVRLVIVGDGDLRPALEAQVAAAGLDGCVEFLGSVPDVWACLADADVFASASRSEAFGIAIAEAMAAGLPVVGPEVGAIPELVRRGVTGALFPAGDHLALAAELVRLLRSPADRARMGAAGQQAATGLRMETAVKAYFALFEEQHRGRRGLAAGEGHAG